MSQPTAFKNSNQGKIIFLLSLSVSAFWISGYFINIYRFAFTGTVFEILWAPMIGMLFFLPVIGLIFLIKDKFDLRSLYLYSLLINITTVLIITFKS